MKTWRGYAKRRGKLRSKLAIWIRHHFDKMERLRNKDIQECQNGAISSKELKRRADEEHANAFTLKQMMKENGLDYKHTDDRSSTYQALATERKDINHLFESFVTSGEFDRAKEQGLSDDKIWVLFNQSAYDCNVFLLYADINRRYRQIDLVSYGEFITDRLGRIDKELKNKHKQVSLLAGKMPSLMGEIKPPAIDGFQDRHKMLVAPDE